VSFKLFLIAMDLELTRKLNNFFQESWGYIKTFCQSTFWNYRALVSTFLRFFGTNYIVSYSIVIFFWLFLEIRIQEKSCACIVIRLAQVELENSTVGVQILVYERHVWMLDFRHTRRDEILKKLIRWKLF